MTSPTLRVDDSAMPVVGLGLWKVSPKEASDLVVSAIQEGYRHLDSACDYGNEKEVGAGIRRAISDGDVTREQLWVTSKLWNTFHRPEHVRAACERSLTDLGLEYLDLYLIHFPISLRFVDFNDRYPPEWLFNVEGQGPTLIPDPVPLHETWSAMETLVTEGLVKHIGVCNYSTALIHDLMSYAKIKPAMLQVELHPYLTQPQLLRTAAQYDIPVTAFSPLGAGSYVELDMARQTESVLTEPTLIQIASRLHRSPAQIALRWAIQRGTAVIPKSMSRQHRQENLALFDFELTSEEMRSISDLNINRRFNDPGIFCESAFGRFHAIYE